MSDTRLKVGTTREDGMVFGGYHKGFKSCEYWVTKEQLEKSRELKRIWMRKFNSQNPKLNAIKCRDWYYKNLDKIKEGSKKYRTKFRERENLRKVNKRKNNPLFHLICKIRSMIWEKLNDKGYTKKSKANEILGCSFVELKNHIESKFTDGMTWENRSKWHIDHIIPISSAKTEEEILKLNHYTNLQPLWAADNIRKGNKMP
jgi:hypothetical protein